jgi:hypothetical protein
MITAIEIENFKGIGETQRIEFAPLTLIFGANSSGKSTIIHALHYLREILETGNGDVDEVRATNGELRLGGFANLVHGHDDESRKIRIRADFRVIDNDILPASIAELKRLTGIDINGPLIQGVKSIGIEIVVGTHFRPVDGISHPLVEKVFLYINGVSLVGSQATGCSWSGDDEGTVANLCSINLEHPAFARIADKSVASLIAEKCGYDKQRFEIDPEEESYGNGVVLDSLGAILTPRSMITMCSLDDDDTTTIDDIQDYYRSVLFSRFSQFFVQVIVDSTKHTIRLLSSLGHLGPIREIPERSRRFSFKTNSLSWFRGQAAWQCILEENPKVGLMVHKGDMRWRSWELDLRDLLSAPYVVQRIGIWTTCENWWTGGDPKGAVQRNLEIVLRDTRTDTLVSLEDVGVGISQVIPVIVAAQEQSLPILFVEQPELHLHPTQQATLGDLFASQTGRLSRWFEPRVGVHSEERTIVIETHSELLLLRMLRRIRETNASKIPGDSSAPRLNSQDLRIYAVESDDEGTKFRCLPISNSGDLIGGWPEGFFDERMDEVL